MMRELIISKLNNALCAALYEDGKLCEFISDCKPGLSGSIVKGSIERYVPGMQAAFVNVGLEKNGFLPLAETLDKEPRLLQAGKEMLLQIKKEPFGDKGVYLTQEISLPGASLIYLPQSSRIGVSAKIKDELRREQLRDLIKPIVNESEGCIVRTAAENLSDEMITNELLALKQKWLKLKETANAKNAPCMVSLADDGIQKLLTDYSGRIERVTADSKTMCDLYGAAIYEGEMPLDTVYNITGQLEDAKKRKVWLKNGGYLVIDPCEALTVIDVNTGKFTGKQLLEDTVLKQNLEACEEIVRQIRLRNVSGIIIVDFIDMQSEAARMQVQKTLEACFDLDRKKTYLHGFTALGLMEISRKKDSLPLSMQKGDA